MNIKMRKLMKQICKTTQGNDALAEKATLARAIARCAEHGQVLVVESGRDCDGVEWRDRTFLLPAVLTAYLHRRDREHAEAEGPIWWQIDRPSNRRSYQYRTRDLTAEAFENGHSHVIYTTL